MASADYKFASSKALKANGNFIGLALDEDSQPEKPRSGWKRGWIKFSRSCLPDRKKLPSGINTGFPQTIKKPPHRAVF